MKNILFFLFTLSVGFIFAQPDIKGGEYFIGVIDPGNGNGTQFTVIDGAWDEAIESIIASAQTVPNTTSPILINIRLKDNSNNWGPLFKKTLFILLQWHFLVWVVPMLEPLPAVWLVTSFAVEVVK